METTNIEQPSGTYYNANDEISLRELIDILVRGWKFIILLTLSVAIIGYIVTFFVLTPVYSISTSVKLLDTSEFETSDDLLFQTYSLDEHQYYFTSTPVLQQTLDFLDFDTDSYNVKSLQNSIKVEPYKFEDSTSSNILEISMESSKIEEAKQILNTLVDEYHLYLEELTQFELTEKIQVIIQDKSVQINKNNDNIEILTSQLATIPMTLNVDKSLYDNPSLQNALGLSGKENNVLIQSQEINPLWLTLQEKILDYQSDNISLETDIKTLENSLLSLKDYAPTIIVLSKAVASENPVKPNNSKNIATATIIGLILSIGIVFFKAYLKNTTQNA